MKPQPLPNLSRVHQQLAGNVNRVAKFLDTLPFHVDNLLAAAEDQDWAEIGRQAEYLKGAGESCGLREITAAAEAIQVAIAADNLMMARRGIVKLVSSCGMAKLPSGKPSASKLPASETDSQRRS